MYGNVAKTDQSSLGIVGMAVAIVGFFTFGILLGPVAVILGWMAMGSRWSGAWPIPAVIAMAVGALDTLVGVLWLAQ